MNAITHLNYLLVSFRTNYSNNNKYANFRYNTLLLNILFILYKDGLVDNYTIDRKTQKVKVRLKYLKNKPLISTIKLLSTPGLKRFVKYTDLTKLYKKYDYFFLSTSQGIISSRQFSKNPHVGGQLLFAFKFNYNQ